MRGNNGNKLCLDQFSIVQQMQLSTDHYLCKIKAKACREDSLIVLIYYPVAEQVIHYLRSHVHAVRMASYHQMVQH